MRLHGFASWQAKTAADGQCGCTQTDTFDSETCRRRHLNDHWGYVGFSSYAARIASCKIDHVPLGVCRHFVPGKRGPPSEHQYR